MEQLGKYLAANQGQPAQSFVGPEALEIRTVVERHNGQDVD